MIGKIALLISLLISGFFFLSQTFQFSQTPSSNPTQVNNQNEVNRIMPEIKSPFDFVNIFGNIKGFFRNIQMTLGNIFTENVQSYFPSATPTFGILITALIALLIIWLVSLKFDVVLRAIFLVLFSIIVIGLILSMIGVI